MITQPHILLHGPRASASGHPLERPPLSLGTGRTRLRGIRRFVFPFLAAQARSNQGPARHALSQMVVAGLMHPSPPVRILVEKS